MVGLFILTISGNVVGDGITKKYRICKKKQQIRNRKKR